MPCSHSASVYSSPRAPHQPASECPCVPFAPRRTSLIRIYPLTRDTAGRPLLRIAARCMSRNVRIVPIWNRTQASSSSARRRAAGSAPTHSLATSPAPRLRMYIGLFAPLPLVATTNRAALRGLHYARPSHRCSPQQAGRRTTETNKQAIGAEPTVRDGLERRRNQRPQSAIWDYTCVPLQLFGTQVKYLRFFKYFYQYLVPRTPPARTPPPVRRLAKLAHARSPPGECTADDMGRATPRGTGPLAHRSSTTSSSACRRSRCLSWSSGRISRRSLRRSWTTSSRTPRSRRRSNRPSFGSDAHICAGARLTPALCPFAAPSVSSPGACALARAGTCARAHATPIHGQHVHAH